nr:TadE family protein [Sphingobium bisphenolivorans]
MNALKSESGAAAAEMALVLPFLVALMFGSFELGNYFLNEHVIVKAVRDGARYASRQSFSYYPCSSAGTGLAPGGTVTADTQALTRTGQVTSGGSPRLPSWQSNTGITVTYDCVTTNGNADYAGVYASQAFVPRVRVSVSNLAYSSLFQSMGILGSNLTLNAESQAAVAGL